jgi:excisionase family DNA binding protein
MRRSGLDGVRVGDRRDPAGRPPSKPASTTNTLLDVSDAAELLGVTERFVRRLVAERRIPFYKIGKFIRFKPTDVVDWVDARRIEPRR